MAKKKSNKKCPGTKNSRRLEPLAALYNLDADTERGDAVRAVLATCGIRAKTVDADMLGELVGAIAGLPGFHRSKRPYDGQAPESEFMLLHNVKGKQLDELLAAMREADCSVGCKAQVTQHNRLWPFAVLVSEVSREHAAMTEQAQR